MWVLRFDNGVTSAGVAVDATSARRRCDLADGAPAWQRLLARYPDHRARSSRVARPTRGSTWMPRLSYRAAGGRGPRWAMLPSAAAFVDPLFSTGFPLTLLGDRASRPLHRRLGRRSSASAIARAYPRDHACGGRPHGALRGRLLRRRSRASTSSWTTRCSTSRRRATRDAAPRSDRGRRISARCRSASSHRRVERALAGRCTRRRRPRRAGGAAVERGQHRRIVQSPRNATGMGSISEDTVRGAAKLGVDGIRSRAMCRLRANGGCGETASRGETRKGDERRLPPRSRTLRRAAVLSAGARDRVDRRSQTRTPFPSVFAICDLLDPMPRAARARLLWASAATVLTGTCQRLTPSVASVSPFLRVCLRRSSGPSTSRS